MPPFLRVRAVCNPQQKFFPLRLFVPCFVYMPHTIQAPATYPCKVKSLLSASDCASLTAEGHCPTRLPGLGTHTYKLPALFCAPFSPSSTPAIPADRRNGRRHGRDASTRLSLLQNPITLQLLVHSTPSCSTIRYFPM